MPKKIKMGRQKLVLTAHFSLIQKKISNPIIEYQSIISFVNKIFCKKLFFEKYSL